MLGANHRQKSGNRPGPLAARVWLAAMQEVGALLMTILAHGTISSNWPSGQCCAPRDLLVTVVYEATHPGELRVWTTLSIVLLADHQRLCWSQRRP